MVRLEAPPNNNNKTMTDDALVEKLSLFDWKFYLNIYSKLRTNGVLTKDQAVDHYSQFGFKENRWISPHEKPSILACIHVLDIIPAQDFIRNCTYPIFNTFTLDKRLSSKVDSFDWKFYLHFNPDLKSAANNMTSELQALSHYKRYGFYERRWSSPLEQPSPSACSRAKRLHLIDDNQEYREYCNRCQQLYRESLFMQQKLETFDWEFYLSVNPDLRLSQGVSSKEEAVDHYKRAGYKEDRWASPYDLPSVTACIHSKDAIDASYPDVQSYCEQPNKLTLQKELNVSLNGCRYIFLDVGSHIGMHIKLLYEPTTQHLRSGGSLYAESFFDRYFMKGRIRGDVCAVGFEPNYKLKKRHEALQKHYSTMGVRVHFINYGLGHSRGYQTYYMQSGDDYQKVSRMKDDPDARAFRIPVINLVDFISTSIKDRYIPEPKYASDPPPTVIMKMDIEGEEIEILPSLIDSGVLCDINVLTVEWHKRGKRKHQQLQHQQQEEEEEEKSRLLKDDDSAVRLKQLLLEANLVAFEEQCTRFEYYIHNGR